MTTKAQIIIDWFKRRGNKPADFVDVAVGVDRGNISVAITELFDAGVLEKVEGKNKMCMQLVDYHPEEALTNG